MKKQLEADVVIIGAGITGTSLARELSKYKLETVLVEKEGHIASGQTKGSSGTIYGGGLNNVGSLIVKSFAAPNAKLYDPEYQRLKFQHEGREMWPQLLEDLDIEHEYEPVVVVARNKEEMAAMEAELKLGQSIGGQYANIRWLDKDALLALYPHLTKDAIAALYSERDGILTYAWQLALAMAENAEQNGVKVLLDAGVTNVAQKTGYQLVETVQGPIKTKFVVNAAGVFADTVADMGGPRNWGLYNPQAFNIVLDKCVDYTLKGTLFLPATPGVVVVIARTMSGNIIINAGKYRPARDKYDVATYRDGFALAMETAKKIIPGLSARDIIRSFVALRSFNTRDPEEHIIEPSRTNPRFINVVVRLPGLSGQPAISRYVVNLLGDAGLELTTKSDFNPYRKAIPRFRDLDDDAKSRLIARDPRYGRVICRCETITEGEIVEAIKRGARTVAGVKYMTRAGMGRCQGGFCGPRVVSILARELNIPVTAVTEFGAGSPVVPYRSKELLQKAAVRAGGESNMVLEAIDVAIIGAGPAGLAAAIKAKETGAENVTIIERAEQAGGLLHQCIHNGFGLIYFKEDLSGPEYARRFIEKAMDLKINLQLETMALDMTAGRNITVSNKGGVKTSHAKAIVLAMGCRERTRHQIMIPGTRPAGVFTAGTAQRYVNVEGYLPGKRIVILGSGDVGMIMARRLTLEGAKVEAVVEILPYVGGLIRNEVQCIRDFNIPLFLQHTVTEIRGQKRVEGVTIAKIDKRGEPIAGTEKTIECDTLLTSVGLIPENELSLKAGVALDPVTGGPLVNDLRETNIPGIFAGGNVVHVNDLVDNVTLESEIAGASAAAAAMGKAPPSRRKISLKAGENVRYIVPHTICSEKEVAISLRVKEPAEKVTLRVGEVFSKPLRVVKPGEMLKVYLAPEQLDKIKEGIDEVEVKCIKRE